MNDEQQLPIQHARVALSAFAGSSKLLARVFTGSGLSPEIIAKSRFSFNARTLETVAGNVARLFGPAWFLGLPALWSLRVQSEFGAAIRFSSTLGEGLDVVVDYLHVRWPICRVQLSRVDREVVLQLAVDSDLSEPSRLMLGILAALNFQTTVAAMIGDDVARLRYEFVGPPPDHAAQVARLLSGRISWGHAEPRLILPAEMLDRVSLTADADSFEAMIQSLRAMAARGTDRRTTAQVREALRQAQPTASDAISIATTLKLSRRTMERRLHEEGTSFRALQDEAYKARLLQIAADPRETADSIAEQMGYHDASSLQRACRRWFGKTFGRVRAEIGRRRS